MDFHQLIKRTEQYVTKLFEDNRKENLVFHNLQHTKYVVEKMNEIAGHYRLNENDLLALTVAAWFHDTGYLFVSAAEHEEKGVEIMKTFLEQYHGFEAIADQAAGCILATRFPRSPKNLSEEIICDADTYNLGTKDFKDTNKQVYKEINFQETIVSKDKFAEQAYKMLAEHEYFTEYAKENLDIRKRKNMEKLKTFTPALEKMTDAGITEKQGTTKGMQTMLRLTSSNHIKLSDMADSKANILISVNAIIISLVVSILLRKLQTDPYLAIPTILFLLVAVITIVIAILATRPKITLGTFNESDILGKKTNLLFFGNFYKMDLEKYETAMRSMMRDPDYLYSSIVKDIYYLGVVLGKKYRLLRLAYNIFMIGIIISVIAFALAAFFLNPATPEASAVSNATGSPF